MDNFLEKTCVNLGIKLVYTNNRITALSAEVKNGLPILRVHKLFKTCPPAVAQAVINYYKDLGRREDHEKVITDYLRKVSPENQFKLKPSDTMFINGLIENMPSNSSNEEADSSLVEFSISSLTITDFWGNETHQRHNSLTPSSNDILDVKITVKPPVT